MDVTAAFGAVSAQELAAFGARLDRLRDVIGDEGICERLALRRAKVAGVGEGLIRREIFVATAARRG
jgi:hypothetical protein